MRLHSMQMRLHSMHVDMLKLCLSCREAGAVASLVALLQPSQELPSNLLKAVLKVSNEPL